MDDHEILKALVFFSILLLSIFLVNFALLSFSFFENLFSGRLERLFFIHAADTCRFVLFTFLLENFSLKLCVYRYNRIRVEKDERRLTNECYEYGAIM